MSGESWGLAPGRAADAECVLQGSEYEKRALRLGDLLEAGGTSDSISRVVGFYCCYFGPLKWWNLVL